LYGLPEDTGLTRSENCNFLDKRKYNLPTPSYKQYPNPSTFDQSIRNDAHPEISVLISSSSRAGSVTSINRINLPQKGVGGTHLHLFVPDKFGLKFLPVIIQFTN
jgi:hypothetical protein